MDIKLNGTFEYMEKHSWHIQGILPDTMAGRFIINGMLMKYKDRTPNGHIRMGIKWILK